MKRLRNLRKQADNNYAAVVVMDVHTGFKPL